MGLPNNFSFFVPNKIAASSMPGEYGGGLENELETLWDIGIRSILSLHEEPLETYRLDGGREFTFLHEPMPDHSVPDSFEPVDRAIDFIRSMLKTNKPVLVHCYAGIGRTGLVLACYVAAVEKLSGREALRFLDMKRGPLETPTQAQFVMSYALHRNPPDL